MREDSPLNPVAEGTHMKAAQMTTAIQSRSPHFSAVDTLVTDPTSLVAIASRLGRPGY
jgi:hypothetical protein